MWLKYEPLTEKEHILGKGENAGYKLFLCLGNCFQKPSSPEVVNPFSHNDTF